MRKTIYLSLPWDSFHILRKSLLDKIKPFPPISSGLYSISYLWFFLWIYWKLPSEDFLTSLSQCTWFKKKFSSTIICIRQQTSLLLCAYSINSYDERNSIHFWSFLTPHNIWHSWPQLWPWNIIVSLTFFLAFVSWLIDVKLKANYKSISVSYLLYIELSSLSLFTSICYLSY